MASQDSLEVQLDLVTSGATKALDGFKKSFNKSFSAMNVDLGKTASGIGGVAKKLINVQTAAIAAGGAILTFFASKQVISKAIEEENAINGVALALARSGEFSKAALRDVENFAEGLQQQSVFSAEEILNQFALAKAYGATAGQAKLITRASIELAAATGKTLDEASSQVTKTLSGQAGQLAKLSPRIKALTSEQLKNGEAARILIEQYGGTAVGKINTFGGALAQSRNVFEDLLTQVGYLITKNPVVVEGIKSLTEIFVRMAKYLEQNRDAIIDFVNNGIVYLLETAPLVGNSLKFLVNTIAILTKSLSLATAGFNLVLQAILNFAPIKILFDGIVAAIGAVVGGLLDLLAVLAELPGVSDTLEAMGFNVQDLSSALDKASDSAYDLVKNVNVDKINEGVEVMNDFAFSVADGADAVKNDLNKAIDAGVAKAGALAKAVKGIGKRGQVELQVKNNEESVKASIDSYQGFLEAAFGGEKGQKIGDSLLTGIANGLKNGKEGARQLLSGLAASAADAFIPGIGKIVGPLIDVLSQGPEAVRQMVKDFAGAIPDLIEAIIVSIPVLIEELANQLPIVFERLAEKTDVIILALVESIPKVAFALATLMPKVALAQIKQIPRIAASLIGELVKGAGRFVSELVRAVGNAVKKFLGLGGGEKAGPNGVGGGAKGLLTSGPTKNAFANAGLNIVTLGGSGVASKVFKSLGIKFAKGGEVPSGFPNDTLPAKLSSGELVIDRTTNRDLKQFLSSGGSGASDVLLAKIVELLSQPMETQAVLRLDNREFATAMLKQSRTRQRTT